MSVDSPSSSSQSIKQKRLHPFTKHRKNLKVNGKRISLSLEYHLWEALDEIAHFEQMSVNTLCEMVSEKAKNGSLTSNIRIFILLYYKFAAHMDGDFSEKLKERRNNNLNSVICQSVIETLNDMAQD